MRLAGFSERGGQKGGEATGPNPTDRTKPGAKRHLVVDCGAILLAVRLSAANVHDSRMLETTLDAIPLLRQPHSQRGRPCRRPHKLHAGKGYGYPRCRAACRQCGILPRIGRRDLESRERLGRHRWVVERTLAWLHGLERDEEGLAAYDRALGLAPNNADAWYNKPFSLRALSQAAEAEQAERRARQLGC